MQTYEIRDIYSDDKSCHIVAYNSKKYSIKIGNIAKTGTLNTTKTIVLPNKASDKLKIGNKIRICQSKDFDPEDYAYLYHGEMYMPKMPISYDKYSCESFIKNLPGIFDSFKLDRAIFKIAIARDCWQRNVYPTLVAWRNLRKMCLDEKYPLLKRLAELTR